MSKNNTILITGGAQGLGATICKTLSCEENRIIVADLQYEKGQEVVKEIEKDGCKGAAYKVDLCDKNAIDEMFTSIKQRFGDIDVLINNAGIDVTKSIMDMTVEEWDRVINVNLRAPFLLTKLVLPMMIKNNRGHIINIISTAALRGWTEASAYHASKWGLRGFTQALYTEARRNNIKVSAIIAGGMKTPFLLDRFPDLDLSNLQDPVNVSKTIQFILSQPPETIIPEVMVIPLQETSWP